MVFFNRRGEDISTRLFYVFVGLVLVSLFIGAVFFKIRSATSDQQYYQRYFSRDIALIIDSMHAGEGDFSINYEMLTAKESYFDAILEPDRVTISPSGERGLSDPVKSSFLFAYNNWTIIRASASHDSAYTQMYSLDNTILGFRTDDSPKIAMPHIFNIRMSNRTIAISNLLEGDISLPED